jgi:UTP--glucose-1-phosphate uridylyltransferase
MSVKKAIFVVAGFGTRFLPATKAQPKEMLPIVNKPIIQYLVEEAVEAGIEEIIFVTGRGKNSIENHFDKSYELEDILEQKGKSKVLREISEISDLANFAYVRQPIQRGDGHALLCARPFVDDYESVLMIFPDYIMPKENQTIKKMLELYEKENKTIIATDYVPMEKVSDYGVIAFDTTDKDNVVSINQFVEKPKTDEAPSNLINIGYGILTPKIWEYLESAESSTHDAEIRVADAYISMLNDGNQILAITPDKEGYDCGSVLGFLKATVDFGLERCDIGSEFLDFLRTKL